MRPGLNIQWHITNRCGNRCRHCYMFEPGKDQTESFLSLGADSFMKILNHLKDFEDKYCLSIDEIALTGGDPLLHDNWCAIVKELNKRAIDVSLMGNPETLTKENAEFLAEQGIESYQMSLDGLEQTHDRVRYMGSFNKTLEKLELLDDLEIHTNIMFTCFPENMDDLIPLMSFVAQNTPARSFSFDIGCLAGNAVDLESFKAFQIRSLFSDYLKEKDRLDRAGYSVRFGEKPNLFMLNRFENGDFYPLNSSFIPHISGCPAGWSSITILPDGTVLPCRRMPIPIGKMPEQSFEEIFLDSELLRKLRRREYFDGCGQCEFSDWCRGCPAVVYGLTGDPFADNPLCFKDLLTRPISCSRNYREVHDIRGDRTAEMELVRSSFSATLPDRISSALEKRVFRKTFLDLVNSKSQRKQFLISPECYILEAGSDIDEESLILLMYFFGFAEYNQKKPGELQKRLSSAILGKVADDIFL